MITPEQHAAWFARYAPRDDDFVFIIEDVPLGNRPVGQVAVYGIDWAARRGEFGRLMIGDRDAVGRGLAGAATRLVIELARTTLNLGELHLEVYADNAPALHIYRACGFIEGARHDNLTYMHLDLTSSPGTPQGR